MRRRSHWAWGWEDRLPDPATRQTLGAQAAALLGFGELRPIEPRPLDAVEMPEPRVAIPDALAGLCQADRRERALHTRGRAWPDIFRGLTGDFRTAPDLVARPRTEEEVHRVLEVASERRLAVIPFGGGTSVVGGVEFDGSGYSGVISLDLGDLDQVLEVEPTSLSARIQAGATGPALEAALATHGLTLRHYPQSFEHSTLGGWIATRAGGHFATVYTHIDDLVASTRMITPSGTWASRRLPGSGAGPSPDRLVLGSEGTLGVITEAWMRVRPRPRFRASASVHFTDWGAAVRAVREVAQARLYPSNCRLLDKREALLNGVATGDVHILLLAFEGAHHPVDGPLKLALEIAEAHGGTCPAGPKIRADGATADGEAGSWRKAFVDAPYLASALATVGVLADTFETACTWDRLDALHADVIRSVRDTMRRLAGAGTITCRFTHVYPDGPAPYFTFITPAVPGGELEQWAAIKEAASEALMRHSATITHHHAVGRLHRPWYDRQRPALFAEALKATKRTLDPACILNPGVLVGPSRPQDPQR